MSFITVVLITLSFFKVSSSVKLTKDTLINRDKRSVFPTFSSFGYIAAVAIPLDLTLNTYLSFTFEANYGLPNNYTHKDFLQRWDPEEYLPSNISSRGHDEKRSVKEHPFSSRLSFYKSVTQYFHHFGYNGRECLLRTICEVIHHELEVFNGVWGSILHVLFLPSTSQDEGLSEDFDIAEYYGRVYGCERYHKKCDFSLIELITSEFEF